MIRGTNKFDLKCLIFDLCSNIAVEVNKQCEYGSEAHKKIHETINEQKKLIFEELKL